MERTKKRKHLVWGVPGLVLELGGNVAFLRRDDVEVLLLGALAILVGVLMLIVAVADYARQQGAGRAGCAVCVLTILNMGWPVHLVLALVVLLAEHDRVVAPGEDLEAPPAEGGDGLISASCP